MTSITGIRCIRVSIWFPCGNTSQYMATHTSTNHLIMVQRCNYRRPGTWRYAVTRFAYICGIRMVTGFASCNIVVMTVETSTNHFIVI